MELKHETIIITGGTSGIGLEMAEQLSALGNTVIVTGRNPERLAQLRRSHPQLHTYSVEVTDLASIESFYKQVVADFPNVNILINNAGLMQAITFADWPASLLGLPILHSTKLRSTAPRNSACTPIPRHCASSCGAHPYASSSWHPRVPRSQCLTARRQTIVRWIGFHECRFLRLSRR